MLPWSVKAQTFTVTVRHSYCSDNKHPLCRTTCPSSALASSILATYSTFTVISIEMTFTNNSLGEISLNESTSNIYSLKLLSQRYFSIYVPKQAHMDT